MYVMNLLKMFLLLGVVFLLSSCSEENVTSLEDALPEKIVVDYHEKDTVYFHERDTVYYHERDTIYHLEKDSLTIDSILAFHDSVSLRDAFIIDSIQTYYDSISQADSCIIDSIKEYAKQNDLTKDSLLNVLSNAQKSIDSLIAVETEYQQIRDMFSWMDSLPALNVLERHKVACLGNSITIHEPFNDIGWNSMQGMAASKLELDYVHQMDYLLKKYNTSSEAIAVTIKNWEKDFSISLDSVVEDKLEGVDVIVVRVGENMPEYEDSLVLEAGFDSLFAYCKRHADYVITSGLYWTNAKKESACIRAARRHGIKYVDISWIYPMYGNLVMPQVGDTLYDENGIPYEVESDFIRKHPNDFGMRLIADEIFKRMVEPAQIAE